MSSQLASRRSGAVVIGSDYRQLGLIRSLGRKRVPVWVLANEYWLGRVTRYATRVFVWPAGTDAERLAFLRELSLRHHLETWALFPGEDRDTALIAQHHTDLSRHYALTTPAWPILRWAHDKRLTYQLASDLGIDHPWTYQPRDRSDVEGLDCRFPVILKPAERTDRNALTAAKAWRADDRAALLRLYNAACAVMDPAMIMVQEFIPGGGEAQFSYAALCEAGRPLASLVVRRARQWPVQFGRSSTHVETVDLPEVEALAERFLDAAGISGPVEVEFKHDARSGRYKLLDVNARIWGWHSVGRAAGVDFPLLAWQTLQGRVPPRVRGRAGVRWVHGVTDFPMAVLQIARGQLSPLEYLRSMRPPIEPAVFALDDPLPALVEVPMMFALLWNRRREIASLLDSHGAPARWAR